MLARRVRVALGRARGARRRRPAGRARVRDAAVGARRSGARPAAGARRDRARGDGDRRVRRARRGGRGAAGDGDADRPARPRRTPRRGSWSTRRGRCSRRASCDGADPVRPGAAGGDRAARAAARTCRRGSSRSPTGRCRTCSRRSRSRRSRPPRCSRWRSSGRRRAWRATRGRRSFDGLAALAVRRVLRARRRSRRLSSCSPTASRGPFSVRRTAKAFRGRLLPAARRPLLERLGARVAARRQRRAVPPRPRRAHGRRAAGPRDGRRRVRRERARRCRGRGARVPRQRGRAGKIGTERKPVALAPWLLAAALVPLGLLLWRRARSKLSRCRTGVRPSPLRRAGSAWTRRAAATLVDAPASARSARPRAELRERGSGRLVTYSPKVFIPLTQLCRDVCHYCTFARPPRRGERAYMTEDEVLAVARAGAEAGCHEALFTLGDKPELRYRAAREELAALGCATTLEYLARCARAGARRDRPAAARERGRHAASTTCSRCGASASRRG